MDNDQSLIEATRDYNAGQVRHAGLNAAAWSAWSELLDDVLDKMPTTGPVAEMDECGDKGITETGAEHIDKNAMRLALNVVRGNADAIAAAYQRTSRKLSARTERRLAELAEDEDGAAAHVHTEDCLCVMVPTAVEGATECHYCGVHGAYGKPCGDRCDIARAEVIARG